MNANWQNDRDTFVRQGFKSTGINVNDMRRLFIESGMTEEQADNQIRISIICGEGTCVQIGKALYHIETTKEGAD